MIRKKWSLKISHKVILGFAIVLLLTVVNGIVAYTSLNSIAALIERFYNQPHTVATAVERVRINANAIYRAMKDVALAQNADEIRKASEQVDDYEQRALGHFAVIKERFIGDQQKVHELEEMFIHWKTLRDESINLALSGKQQEAIRNIQGNGADYVEGIIAATEELAQFTRSTAEQFTQEAEEESRTAITIMLIIVALTVVFSVTIAVVIVRGITRSLGLIQSEIDTLAERGGDLTQEIKLNANDEIGEMARSINRFIANLRNIIAQVKTGSDNVAAASQQIAAASEEVASASNEQSVSAQTMNELFKELVTSIENVARNAEVAAELSANTESVAKDGGVVIHSSIEGMNQVSQHIAKLEEDSNQIGNIIEVIDEIADQTNLLALNAAIEAARAGDQGRGFAVVADEVRKLAERSGEATKQITAIIKGMQNNTENSVKAVNEGMAKSQETREAFDKIVNMVVELSQKVSEIAAACEEQSAQSQDVIKSIETIAAASEESAASAEESSSTAQSLAQMAEELQGSVAQFKV